MPASTTADLLRAYLVRVSGELRARATTLQDQLTASLRKPYTTHEQFVANATHEQDLTRQIEALERDIVELDGQGWMACHTIGRLLERHGAPGPLAEILTEIQRHRTEARGKGAPAVRALCTQLLAFITKREAPPSQFPADRMLIAYIRLQHERDRAATRAAYEPPEETQTTEQIRYEARGAAEAYDQALTLISEGLGAAPGLGTIIAEMQRRQRESQAEADQRAKDNAGDGLDGEAQELEAAAEATADTWKEAIVLLLGTPDKS